MNRKSLLRLMICMVTTASFADPPFLSSNPTNLDYHDWQVYFYSIVNKNTFNNTDALPGLEFDFGLTPFLELDISIPMALNLQSDHHMPNAYGLGDTQFSFTYPLIHESKYWPLISFSPNVFFPTGNYHRDLGNGRIWESFPFWAQKTIGSWTTYGGGGYAYNTAANNFFFGGIVVEHDFTDNLMLGVELFSTGAAAEDNPAFTLVDVGATYDLSKRFSLLFSVGKNIFGADNFYMYAGITLTS